MIKGTEAGNKKKEDSLYDVTVIGGGAVLYLQHFTAACAV